MSTRFTQTVMVRDLLGTCSPNAFDTSHAELSPASVGFYCLEYNNGSRRGLQSRPRMRRPSLNRWPMDKQIDENTTNVCNGHGQWDYEAYATSWTR